MLAGRRHGWADACLTRCHLRRTRRLPTHTTTTSSSATPSFPLPTTVPAPPSQTSPPMDSARPTTSYSSRPYTSTGQSDVYSEENDLQYPYSHEQDYSIDEEDEEESDDEDVFAFVPPSTADAQALAQHEQQQPTPVSQPHVHPNQLVQATSDIQYPPPTFDPYSPRAYYADHGAGPSSSKIPLSTPPPFRAAESPSPPPSSNSLVHGDETGYRMRPVTAASSNPSGREVVVALPDKDMRDDCPKARRKVSEMSEVSSALDADYDMDIDMEDIDESRSIKYVPRQSFY